MDLNRSNTNIILYLFGKFISLFGTSIYGFAMSFYILSVTGSALNFSISILLATLPRIICSPVAGVIADRFNRKKLVLTFDFLSGTIMIIMFIISSMYGLQIWMIYVSTILLSAFNTFFNISFSSAIPALVKDEQLGKINSLDQTVVSLSQIAGPIVGGLVYALIAPQMFLLINGISFLISTVGEALIDFRYNIKNQEKMNVENQSEKQVRSFYKDMKEGLDYFKKRKGIFAIIKSSLFLNFFFSAINVGLPVIIVLELASSEETLGFVNSMFAVGMLGMSIGLSLIKNLGFNKKVYISSLFTVILLTLLLAIPVLPNINMVLPIGIYYSIVAFLFGSLITLINVPFMVLIQQTVEDQYRGRVMAFISTIASGITPIGIIIHGVLYEKIPSFYILIYISISMTVVTFLLIQWLKGTELDDRQPDVSVES